jgi:hypothetical protein
METRPSAKEAAAAVMTAEVHCTTSNGWALAASTLKALRQSFWQSKSQMWSITAAIAAAGMAEAPVLFLRAVPQVRSDGLPALPTWAEGCHPLIPEVKFDKNEEAQENKQALLKKMRAGDSVNGGGGEAARRRSLMGGEAVRRRRWMEMVPVFG